MRLLAIYLPQFHKTEFNDKHWGEGYTEWSAVKSAKPMYRGHIQPKEPLNNNYYDLADETGAAWKWQAQLAKKSGIEGFCIYHYWLSDGVQLLQKPMEILLEHKELDINYCICWANHDWTKGWYGTEKKILAKQEYGDEKEWSDHFKYLLPFFKDERYIKKDNKPVVCIYDAEGISVLADMTDLWNQKAREQGFNGIYIVSGLDATRQPVKNSVDAYYYFEPGYSYYQRNRKMTLRKDNYMRLIRMTIGKVFCHKIVCGYRVNGKRVMHYAATNPTMINGKKAYLGLFNQWDNTPRKQELGMVYEKTTPQNFGKALNIIKSRVDEDDFVFLNAWNEWGEGNYLEPDAINGYKYLEEIEQVQKG